MGHTPLPSSGISQTWYEVGYNNGRDNIPPGPGHEQYDKDYWLGLEDGKADRKAQNNNVIIQKDKTYLDN